MESLSVEKAFTVLSAGVGGGGGGEAQSACLKVVAGTTEHPSNRHGCENVVPLSAPA